MPGYARDPPSQRPAEEKEKQKEKDNDPFGMRRGVVVGRFRRGAPIGRKKLDFLAERIFIFRHFVFASRNSTGKKPTRQSPKS